MTDTPRAIHADYVGIKTLSGRKVVQITCEVALERLEEVITLLGSPNPSTGKPVGIALLHDIEVDVKREIANNTAEKKDGRKFHDMPLSQQAALLCKNQSFEYWVRKNYHISNSTSIKDWIYDYLQIKSRADLDVLGQNQSAKNGFCHMRDDYYASTKQYPEQRG